MVHSALLNADIVSIIFESLDKYSLSVLARTARLLQVPALRELWRDIQLSHLLSPFESSVKRARGKYSFCNDPTSTQWDRFNFYAQFVRGLTIPYYGYTIEPPSLRILSHQQPLLPHLKSLCVLGPWEGHGMPSLSMFFVPSIQRFTFHSCQDFLALESLMMKLGTTASTLRHLNIAGPQLPTRRFLTSISIFNKLYSIDIPLTGVLVHSILSHLSTLPSLSKMQFFVIGLTSISGTGPKYSFPAARELQIRSESEDQPTYFLALTLFDNLSNLTIFCNEYPIDDDSLCTAISVSCGQPLKHIQIGAGRKDPKSLKFSTLDPLSKFTNLRSFTLVAKETRWPADGDILDIAKAWPNLEEFRVDPFFSNDPNFPLSLTGLLLLIKQCPSLMEISVPINADHVPNFTNSISRPGLAIDLNPWYSRINDPIPLAEFLFLALPDSIIIMSEDSLDRKPFSWVDTSIIEKISSIVKMKGRI